MTRFASLSADERSTYVGEAAARIGVAPLIVEKDFWVCWMLARLFESPMLRGHLVFKGGTSLSKVFDAIQRFSEDVDLSISVELLGKTEAFLEEAGSPTQMRKRMAEIERLCADKVEHSMRPALEGALRELLGAHESGRQWLSYALDPLTNSPVLTFAYPTAMEEGGGYIPKSVKIELGSLTDQRPTASHTIRPMLATVLPESFDDFSAWVVALELERSFWEKATILHAEHHRPAERAIRDRVARHYYDFAALWRHPGRTRALERLDLLERVALHKTRFFASGWASYETASPGALKLLPTVVRRSELAADYARMAPMFLVEPPRFESLMEDLGEAERTINSL